ncbi:hypothetical protein [Aestuariispira insulae]|uniref:Uncharacterized protein n=1 Tax=Aestuariispira insulae TaxID=1461337 RepID=A0A3D9HGG4_9PROT|nr:hypothetical protein [Aestuariispira insulae]RED48086.1 hypothetical protein DFP90_108104 [Aestuariispira insulae]
MYLKTSDPKYHFGAAMLLIKSHGEQASDVAREKADRFAREGDLENQGVWYCIGQAVNALQNMNPDILH